MDYSSIAQQLGGQQVGSAMPTPVALPHAPQTSQTQSAPSAQQFNGDYGATAQQFGGTSVMGQQGQQPQQEGAQLHDTGSFLGNAANSAGNFASGIGQAIAHPIDTVTNIGRGLIGAGENLGAAITGKPQLQDKNTEIANNIGSFITQRYGSLDAAKKTAFQDPVGFLADAAGVLSGVGAATEAVGVGIDSSRIADVGQVISKAGEMANPVNAITKPIEGIANYAKSGLENLAPKLEETSLRLTPAKKAEFQSKLADVTDYISKKIPLGDPEARYQSAINNVNSFEDKMQNFLTKTAKGVEVDKGILLNQVEGLKSSFSGERDAIEIDSQIDGFKKLLESKYGDTIPVADLNKLKRSTYQSAFNQAGTKVSDAVEYNIGDLLRQQIEDSTKGLKIGNKDVGQFNKDYGTALTAKKLLKIAQGRPQVDFVNRLIMDSTGGMIGSAFGGPIGAAVGTAAGNAISRGIPATAIRSAVGKTATKIGGVMPKIKIPSKSILISGRANQAQGSEVQRP